MFLRLTHLFSQIAECKLQKPYSDQYESGQSDGIKRIGKIG